MSIVLALALLLQSAGGRQVEITVRDAQGLAIEGARITVTEKATGARKTATSSSEATRVDGLSAGEYEVRVEKDGFTAQTTPADLKAQNSATVNVQLEVGGLSKNVVVSATRTEQEVGNLPASITLVSDEELKASPAIATDDILRQITTSSLFRRTSSLAAHPTAQGVSLRGVGPSGVSRTLVLIDGVPFNDPFGGWVYWTRVPLESTDRIEIVDGSSSSLYGNYAMGGVINIVTSRPARRTVEFKPQFGNKNSPKADFFASDVWGKLGVAVEGSVFNTDGFPIVAAAERGPIDINADLKYRNVNSKIEYAPSDRFNVFFRGGYFTEDRTNGKIGEVNDTRWKFANGGV